MSEQTVAFKAQLGNKNNPGLMTSAQRLKQIKRSFNPYITGTSLPANSPVFYGRAQALHEILASLRRLDKPGCISLLGERRIGKSSLLNQVFAALAKEPALVSIHATVQDWDNKDQKGFFSNLHQQIALATDEKPDDGVKDYPSFRDFIYQLNHKSKDHRFVLILDEFEGMADNPNFDAKFFENLRTLGERPEYRFGYLISSRDNLQSLCKQKKIQGSMFWNIFGFPQILGLLSELEAKQLLEQPMYKSLHHSKRPDPETLWSELFPQTGHHPALLQMVAASHWSARDGGFEINQLQIESGLREYLDDLWYQRSKEEISLLAFLLANSLTDAKVPGKNAILNEMKQRGLVTQDDEIFSNSFREFVIENLDLLGGLDSFVNELSEKIDRIDETFKKMENIANRVGRVFQRFRSPNDDSDEDSET